MNDNWLIELRPSTAQIKSRLICFPFAGGGTSNFARWSPHLREDIGLYAFNLPGRERFYNRPYIPDYRLLIETMQEQIKPLTDLPLIFFGHSFGALTAYFNTLELIQSNNPSVSHLFISARRPPDSNRINKIAHLSENEFLDHIIKEYNGIPDLILNNKEMMAIFLPIIQHDFTMYEQFQEVFASYKKNQVTCDLTSIGYAQDLITQEEFDSWSAFTTRKHKHHTFPGGHFQILDEPLKAIQLINNLQL